MPSRLFWLALIVFLFAPVQPTLCQSLIEADSLSSCLLENERLLHNGDSTALKNAFQLALTVSCDSSHYFFLRQALDCQQNEIGGDVYFEFRFLFFKGLIAAQEFGFSINEGKQLLSELRNPKTAFERDVVLSTLATLRTPYRNSSKIQEGVEFFLERVVEYENQHDSDFISMSYYVLRSLYSSLGLMEKAIYFQKKSMLFLNPTRVIRPAKMFGFELERHSIGIVGYINRNAVLAYMYDEMNMPELAFPLLDKAMLYCEKYKDSLYLADRPFVYMEVFLNRLKLNYPDLLQYLQDARQAMQEARFDVEYLEKYYHMKVLYFLHQNSLDSAATNANMAVELLDSLHLNLNSFTGVFYPRYLLAKVSLLQGKPRLAKELLLVEIEQLKAAMIRNYILMEYLLLADAYRQLGDNADAFGVLKQHLQLSDEIHADEFYNRTVSFETEQRIAHAESQLLKRDLINRRRQMGLQISVILLFAFALVIIVLVRSYRTKQTNSILLANEKARSDDLLLNILPEEVADDLKKSGKSDAKSYDNVTVLFADFVNFTAISEQLNPRELVQELHDYFTAFDEVVEKYGLEKIKTIGDAYLAVSGMPKENPLHAELAVKAALEIRNHVCAKNGKFKIRIGLNSGPVVAGIVGIKKYAYDIWGDTVNTAARMEQLSVAGKVNISESTYTLVRGKFLCYYRGRMQAKNKGEIAMYFVDSEQFPKC